MKKINIVQRVTSCDRVLIRGERETCFFRRFSVGRRAYPWQPVSELGHRDETVWDKPVKYIETKGAENLTREWIFLYIFLFNIEQILLLIKRELKHEHPRIKYKDVKSWFLEARIPTWGNYPLCNYQSGALKIAWGIR